MQLFVLICMHIEQVLKCIAMCEFKGRKIDKYKWPCWIYTMDPISSMMSHEVRNISCNCDCKFYSLASHSVSNDHCLRLLGTTIWSKYCEEEFWLLGTEMLKEATEMLKRNKQRDDN